MSKVIACPSCQQQLSLPSNATAGAQVRCPSCQALMVVPGARAGGVPTQAARPLRTDAMSKPLVSPSARVPSKLSASSVKPASHADAPDDSVEPARKKKSKGKKSKTASTSGFNRTKLLILCGALLFSVTVITLIVVFVPFGKMLSGAPEAQVVDVYTAINAMGYNNVGVRVLNSDTAAYTIPGPRKIMITRPNPNGQYLMLRLKVPYSDVDAFFPGARGRIYLHRSNIQVEANGETRDAVFVQDENAAVGHFQMDYQPPHQEGLKVSLRDYVGPKAADGWTHQGSTKEYEEGILFEGSNGMQVKISVGAERQDGGGGNVLESLTGKKILGNQQGLTGGVAGYVHVDWNQGSAGHIVHSELEQPNEIGLKWNVNCIVELPKNAGNEVTLKVLGKTRKLRIR